MRRFRQFWSQCTSIALKGSASFANDWQWVVGIPMASFAGAYIASARGVTDMTTGYPIADAFIAAFVAFVITWGVAFLVRMSTAASQLYWEQKDRPDDLKNRITPKIETVFDEHDTKCWGIVPFADGSRSRICRLRVNNTGTSRLQCEGWLACVKEFPQMGKAKLFWVGMPEQSKVDLVPKMPDHLQVFRIHESNKVIPATIADQPLPSELWPLGSLNQFNPGNTYTFQVGIKAYDESETVFSILELNWTGNWETATVRHVAG
jgi:hypothetical protein